MFKKSDSLLFFSRMLLFAFGVSHILIGIFLKMAYGDLLNDPIELRLVFSFFCFLFFALTFTNNYVKEHHLLFFQIANMFMTLHITYLFFINKPFILYAIATAILWAAAAVFYKENKRFIIFVAFNFVFISILFILIGNQPSIEEFKSTLYVAIPSSFLIRFYLTKYLERLNFSDEIINNVDALIIVGNQNGDITFISENVQRILGYSRAELLGRGWWDMKKGGLSTEEDMKVNIKRLLEHAKDHSQSGYDSPSYHQDGTQKWMNWRDILMSDGSILGVGQDITEKKLQEQELLKLSLIAKESENLVLIINSNDKIEWVNNQFLKSTNFQSNEVLERHYELLFRQIEIENKFSKIIEDCKKNHKNVSDEIDFPTKEKSTLRVQFSCIPFVENGEYQYTICIGKDITEEYLKGQRHLLEQKRKEILYYLDQKIFRAESLDAILSEIVRHVRQLNFNIKRISIASYNFEEEIVQIIYSNNAGNLDTEITVGSFSYPLIDASNTISILKSAEFAINDLNKEQASKMTPTQRFLYNEHGVGCYLTFPINYKDELIGSMNFAAESDVSFTDEVISFLKELAKDIAVAVYQYKLKEAVDIKNIYLEEKNKSITDSIHYAERIQKAILPSYEDYYKCFNDSFVLLQPKDTLSGDFFWVEDTKKKLWIASVDCTGHGVPGALVSLIGANILNQAIFEQELEYPNEVLAYLNENVIKTLQSSDQKINDGMDIAICCIDKKINTLFYSGVMNHLLYIRDNELLECNASRIPIGINPERNAVNFELHEVKIERGDKFYIFTDGFADQFGGDKNKKFGIKKFKKLLLDISDYPMSEQERILKNSLSLWKLDEEQTDDVLVLGFSPKVYK